MNVQSGFKLRSSGFGLRISSGGQPHGPRTAQPPGQDSICVWACRVKRMLRSWLQIQRSHLSTHQSGDTCKQFTTWVNSQETVDSAKMVESVVWSAEWKAHGRHMCFPARVRRQGHLNRWILIRKRQWRGAAKEKWGEEITSVGWGKDFINVGGWRWLCSLEIVILTPPWSFRIFWLCITLAVNHLSLFT